jgi:prenyltransferase beta subunit
VSWQVASMGVLGLVLLAGFGWYERERPPARVLALVAALAALAVVGRLAFAAIPNVKPTTDIVMFAGYALGAVPGFAVGAVTALVSNVFLSQGPWTAWQMVGWGGVGVAAALLARAMRGREPGRVPLAIACGLGGLAFGAWMDVYQWTLAARQDLDSYLAVSASSLPYNLAHAIGNVVFCLLIGPLFVRSLRRYRRRFEVTWEPVRPAAGLAAALVLALAVAAGVGAPPASAASSTERAARYLLGSQNRDGGFGGARSQSSSDLHTGWAALGLAAARRNPRDVRRRRGRTITRYLTRRARTVRDIGEIERTVLVLRAAGLSPRRFAGRNLIAAIRKRRRGDGSIAGFVSYTAFGVLALRASGAAPTDGAVAYLRGAQNGDGGFGLTATAVSDTDMTGATLQALAAAGASGGAVERDAIAYLRETHNADGGFGQFKGRSSNAQSTSYAVQGLIAARAPAEMTDRAIRYLRSLQRGDGSIRYSSASVQTPVWVTAQALAAMRRKALPLGAVPRKRRKKRSPAAAAAPAPAAERRTPAKAATSASKRKREVSGSSEASVASEPSAARPGGLASLQPSGSGAAEPVRTRAASAPARQESLSPWLVAGAVAAVLAASALLRRRLRRHTDVASA